MNKYLEKVAAMNTAEKVGYGSVGAAALSVPADHGIATYRNYLDRVALHKKHGRGSWSADLVKENARISAVKSRMPLAKKLAVGGAIVGLGGSLYRKAVNDIAAKRKEP